MIGDNMKIDELLSKYKDANFRDPSTVVGLNAVANYVMFEQSIIKKDNIPGHSIIKYRYDAYSYKVINDFFSKIEFASFSKESVFLSLSAYAFTRPASKIFIKAK